MTLLDADYQKARTTGTQLATRALFFVSGVAMASWAPLVPYAKSRATLSDGSIGTLLLFLGLGSLLAMPLTGSLVSRAGCKRVMLTGSLLVLFTLPLLAILSSFISLAVALMLFGAALGMIDVAMNIQAVEVEKAAERPMMSGFHGFFSIGGIAGAGLVSGGLALALSPWQAVLIVMVLVVILAFSSHRHLLSLHQPADSGPLFVIPKGWVLFLGILSFILFLTEGAVLDWSALFLHQYRDLPAAQAGLGYAVFSVAMSLGRLTGDVVVKRLGRPLTLCGGAMTAALGILLIIGINHPWCSLLGFLLVGLGASNSVPILFSAAGNQKSMAPGLAISAMTTIGYAGILAGPALIGFVSQGFGLTVAFAGIVVLLLVVAASARLVTH